MLIWLPPSEGKESPRSGSRLDLETLSFPDLNPARREVIESLQSLGAGSDAAHILGLGKRSSAEAALNSALWTAPTAPAIDLYTGVLFDSLDAPSLGAEGRRRLLDCVWIFSGLFGVLRPQDAVPNHRLAMGANLPLLGRMSTWWRNNLVGHVPAVAGETIVDCRSGPYRSALPAPEANMILLAPVEQRKDGRKVISHMAKKWRGLAARHLLLDPNLDTSRATGTGGRDAVLGSLQHLGDVEPALAAVEVGPTSSTRVGGSKTTVTLVIASTAR